MGSLKRTEAEKCILGVGGDGGDDFDLFYRVGRDIRRKDTCQQRKRIYPEN